MAIGLPTAARNARLNLLVDAIDASVDPATLAIYAGAHPGTGTAPGVGTTLLATLTFSSPCEASVADGVLTFDTVTGANAVADGTAVWARLLDGATDFVLDFKSITTTGGGGDLELNTVTLITGGPVSVSSATITEGNP
jgi:hypothetical protein